MNSADVKPLLIDLEAEYNATGGKQAMAVQPERLSEGGLKICFTCKQELDVGLFNKRPDRTNLIQSSCKVCQKRTAKEHRLAMRNWINDWKEKEGCSWCGFKGRHFQLDLDHVDPSTKKSSSHRSYEPNWNKERIEVEVKKCVILCANCHRLKTFNNSDHL